MEARQLWNFGVSATATATATSTAASLCTPFTLPSNGVLSLAVSSIITLSYDATFQPACTDTSATVLSTTDGASSVTDLRDPFYASTLPQLYALAATTVTSYMLFIVLLITPRTFSHGGPGAGPVILGRQGFTNGPSGNSSAIGIGGRPWLQKVASLTVAISLTVATAVTFHIAEQQYDLGYMDATALENEVYNGTVLKVIRVISDTFLWLALAQTLIRLFPRQKEKVIIKWTALALISLDLLFSILNNFVYSGSTRPRTFVDAIPALSYLFQLAINLLYCAWVMYYAITKRRYAFYHTQMRNICLVALLSLVAVLVPVVFFVLDISRPNVAGWGNYVRWVGAAAASVVVWEWVERIEALERNDKKDSVLGREVFDGDEMLEVTPSSELHWPRRLRRNEGRGDEGGMATGSASAAWPGVANVAAHRYARRQDVEANSLARIQARTDTAMPLSQDSNSPIWPARPPAVASPVSRTNTTSAESSNYAVHYHAPQTATPRTPGSTVNSSAPSQTPSPPRHPQQPQNSSSATPNPQSRPSRIPANGQAFALQLFHRNNPFKRHGHAPPAEVSAQMLSAPPADASAPATGFKDRVAYFAAAKAEKFKEKRTVDRVAEAMPVTVIPAPVRAREMLSAEADLVNDTAREKKVQKKGKGKAIQRPRDGMGEQRISTASAARMNDPYTPVNADRDAITRRGGLQLLATLQPGSTRGVDGHEGIDVATVTGDVDSDVEEGLEGVGSAIESRSPVSVWRDGITVTSIPAPVRR